MQTPHDRWLEPRDDEEWHDDEEYESPEPDPEPEDDEYECY